MLDLSLQNYMDWYVKPVMKIKSAYGFRVILKYTDGSEKVQQKAGFPTKYIVYVNILVSEYMEYWLEHDLRGRAKSEETYYTFSEIVKNHIVPAIGNKRMAEVNAGDVQKLYNAKAEYSVSVARLVKSVMNISFRYALNHRFIAVNPTRGIHLPKKIAKRSYHTRNIDIRKTLTLEQIMVLLKRAKKHLSICRCCSMSSWDFGGVRLTV